MRPHVLEVEAFMAFPGRVRLDLDELAESGLLLLCGDTGGGKTTLLDALGFALYGVVPGERAKSPEELRSHHAAPGVRAQVRLEFTARGRRLRVTRTPAQERPKARGTGTVKEQPTALLERLDGERWVPLAQRNEDVGLEIGRLLGMDAGQFFQVVMLPQGRFAAFLQAGHKEREKLLKQLFHVDRFERVEGWLAERASDAARRLDAARAELSAVAARVAQASGAELPEPVEDFPGWAGELAAGAERECEWHGAAAAGQARVRAEAEQALADTESIATRQQARAAALAELSALDAELPAVQALTAELEAARRAAPVVVAARTAGERAAEAVRAREREAEARALLAERPDLVEADVPALRGAAAGLRTELGRLGALREVEERAGLLEQAALAARKEVDALEQELSAAERRVEQELPAARRAAQERMQRARQAERDLPDRRGGLERALAAAALRGELQELHRTRPVLFREAETLTSRAEQAVEVAVELREQRLEAIRFELAALLVDGDPCPVCGALDHPEIAEVRADHVSREREREADRAVEQARQQAEQAGRALALHDARAQELAERCAAAGEPGDVEALRAQVRELEGLATDLGPAESALAALQSEAEQLGAGCARLQVERDSAQRRGQGQAADAASLRDRLAAELGPGVDLVGRLRQVERLAGAVNLAADLAAAADASETAAQEAQRTGAQLAQAAGLDGVDAALRAARDDPWQRRSAERLRTFERQLSGVRARLDSVELDVGLEPPAPVAAARAAAAQARDEHERALAGRHVAERRAEELAKLVPGFELAAEAVPQLRSAADELRGLAELAAGRGSNRLSMPLSTFVLAARLEEVAEAASVRLSRMSGGRYALVHSDTGRDKRSRAGLGLQVEDGWTGRRRDTATLSGGETFMTALALALGLADVVTAEAGGSSIDALFVDEGFGTLDAGSLDQVMDVLDDLRSGGRLVGIVSHVADLRQRIPAQVRVVKTEQGSTVRTTAG